MKLIIVIASFILATTASSDEELWRKFKIDHGKTYKSLREDKLRFDIFKSNLRTIDDHNNKYENGETTWFMGINQFSDLTDKEFEIFYLNYEEKEELEYSGHFVYENKTVPDAIDWRTKGAVLSVKNQGACGSCWAFSTIGAIEGQNALKHNVTVDLSPQELVDCCSAYENHGCHGGWMDNGFKYVRDHGISKLTDYPYTATDGKCKNGTNSAQIKLTGFVDVHPKELALKEAVASVGPISVAMNGLAIKQYAGGIFDNFFCEHKFTHAVLVVGYDSLNNHDYWIVKNSWGKTWGENGYIKMTRNKYNQCGIASKASYPVLE